MSQNQYIKIELLSDAAFGRGEGTAGVVDVEVEHDELGLPFLGGKTIRGLLRDSWLSMEELFPELQKNAQRIFAPEGDMQENSILRIGDGVVDRVTQSWIKASVERENRPISPQMVLEALTIIRRQTSMDRSHGIPAETTLRSTRLVIRGLSLQSPLHWLTMPSSDDIRCLAMALLATRHAGLARNRGQGHIRMLLDGDPDKTKAAAIGGLA